MFFDSDLRLLELRAQIQVLLFILYRFCCLHCFLNSEYEFLSFSKRDNWGLFIFLFSSLELLRFKGEGREGMNLRNLR